MNLPLLRRHRWLFFALGAVFALSAYLAHGRLGAAQTPEKTYSNSDGTVIDKPLSEVLGWMLSSFFAGLPKAPSAHLQGYDFPLVQDAQGVAQARPGELSVTWIGHATTLVRIDGATVLTDPHFSQRASPASWFGPRRRAPLPYALSELPHIDVVVISHNHYDHLDEASVLALSRQPGGSPLFVVPQGLDAWFTARGMDRVQSLGWWQTHQVGALQVQAVPAYHWSARGLTDRNQTHWAGWVLRSGNRSAYFAGDTGYSGDFAAIGARLGPVDLALIPVGAYLPRDFMQAQHVDPTEAVRIHQDVQARLSVGMHWGTFELADDALDAPIGELPAALQRAGLPADAMRLLAHGQTLVVHQARTPPAAQMPQAHSGL